MTEVRVETRSVPAGARFPKDIAPLLARIYAARGLQDALELDRSLGRLITPDALDDIDRAAQRVAQAIRADESILIVGDYDADGATAVAKIVPVSALPATLRPKVGVTTSAPVKWTPASFAALDNAGMNELGLL